MDNCNYSPQISPTNPFLTPMPDTAPYTLTPQNNTILSYPFDTPTTTLTLRNPEFNDKHVITKSQLVRYSRGNDLITYRDSIWPKRVTLNYNFTGLSNEEAQEALDFFQLTLGKYVRLTTYENIEYKGVILAPQNPISQEYPGCGFTLKLDFQGELVV